MQVVTWSSLELNVIKGDSMGFYTITGTSFEFFRLELVHNTIELNLCYDTEFH